MTERVTCVSPRAEDTAASASNVGGLCDFYLKQPDRQKGRQSCLVSPAPSFPANGVGSLSPRGHRDFRTSVTGLVKTQAPLSDFARSPEAPLCPDTQHVSCGRGGGWAN